MLVFGDAVREEVPAAKVARIREHLADASRQAGVVRHGLFVAALIEAGELAQGIADSAFEACGRRDARSPAGEAAMAVTTALAGSVVQSWSSGFEGPGESGIAVVPAALTTLEGLPWPASISVRQAEGFALYAVYPESYLTAAQGLASGTPVEVIGTRSIGTTLAAIVAAALGAPAPATVRPIGHPFHRELSLDHALEAEFRSERSASFAIVDEGPGLSGSSFAAVARRLSEAGVFAAQIHLFPSHGGSPGPQAGNEARAVWARHPRHVATFDDVILNAPRSEHRLESWVSDLIGPPLVPLEDLSGGAWRRRRFSNEADWPPVHAWQERRKFLCTTESGTWLLKFAGLGRVGFERAERARALGEAGLTPKPAGWRHGFLVERWHAEAAIPEPEELASDAFLDRLGAYLAFRASAFRTDPGRGASLEQLYGMALHNAGEALGQAAAGRLTRLRPSLERLQRHVRPVETDSRLHVWEWLRCGGAYLKTDAVDHHAGHDLVGCQDVAWDLAGAAVELSLSPDRLAALAARVEREGGGPVSPELIDAVTPLYVAFQLGYWTDALRSALPGEGGRLAAETARYAGLLGGLLGVEGNCTLGDV